MLKESVEVYEFVWHNIPTLAKLAKSRLVAEKAELATNILDTFIE